MYTYIHVRETSQGITGVAKPATDQPRNTPATAAGPKLRTRAHLLLNISRSFL